MLETGKFKKDEMLLRDKLLNAIRSTGNSKAIKCGLCKTTGTVADRNFNHKH